jgi:hypothetical protein
VKRISSIAAVSVVLLVLCALLGAAMTPNWQVSPLTGDNAGNNAGNSGNSLANNRVTVAAPDTAIAARGQRTNQEGTYQVKETTLRIRLAPSVTVDAVLREPVGATGKRPGCLFIHGAGTGKAHTVYGDIASAMASAGIVTLVPDKRMDNYSTFQRDYTAMARDYVTSLNVLKSRSNVDASRVGLYAESEGTWIASVMTHDHPDLAFMILTSPPVVPGRRQMAMAASNYMTYIGAPEPMVRNVAKFISMDFSMLGLRYADFPAERYLDALTMPLLVNYGTEDLSMPIEQGATMLREHAHQAGNDNVTVRYYPANHQMRVGARTSQPGLPLDESYTHDLENWVNAVAAGASADDWSTPMIAGTQPHQRLAVPKTTTPGLIRSLPVLLILLALAPLCLLVGALGSLVLALTHRRRRRGAQDDRHGSFGAGIAGLLVANAITVVASMAGLLAYLARTVSAALALRNDASALSAGWMALRALALLSIVAFAWLLVRFAENRLAREPEHLPAQNSAPVVAAGFGHCLVLGSLTFSAMFSLVSLAFWGLFTL